MKKIVFTIATVAALGLAAGSAEAGGWGHGGFHSYSYSKHSNKRGNFGRSSGLLNVSPSIGLGDVSLLNGISLLDKSPILSGNVLSGILSGNRTGVGNGILGGAALGILGGGNRTSIRNSRHHRRW